MASIDTGKKGAPHIDMTPMVDLGFLLITFFMLATTMSKPKTMEIIKPAKDDKNNKDVPKVNVKRVQSVLLGENDKVYFYQQAADDAAGTNALTVDSADFSAAGVRAYIRNRQNEVAQAFGSKDTLVVLIKGMPKANYKNFVDIIDEMRITGVRQYAILDRDKIDTTIMENLGIIKK
jgi:biopolymer transport protein ExbD